MKFIISFIFLVSTLFSGMKVYVSNDSPIETISLQELKNLYLKKTRLLNNEKVFVYDNEDEYSQFCNQVINKTDGQLHAYWMKQIFLGNKIPPRRITSSEILHTLNQNPSSITYSEENLDAKVIYEHK